MKNDITDPIITTGWILVGSSPYVISKEIAKNNENNINIKILYEKLILLNILKLSIKSTL